MSQMHPAEASAPQRWWSAASCSGAAAALLCGLMLSGAAKADCLAELQKLRGRGSQVAEPHRREEMARLLEKAEKDARTGRERLCLDAIGRVRNFIDLAADKPH
jgi:hypothetical protein